MQLQGDSQQLAVTVAMADIGKDHAV